ADRSLALVDYALRRRFAFVSLEPQIASPKFKERLLTRGVPPDLVEGLIRGVSALNEQIRQDKSDLGTSFCVGHSYFCLEENTTDHRAWLESVFDYEIQPLLEEYWMERPERAGEAMNELRKHLP